MNITKQLQLCLLVLGLQCGVIVHSHPVNVPVETYFLPRDRAAMREFYYTLEPIELTSKQKRVLKEHNTSFKNMSRLRARKTIESIEKSHTKHNHMKPHHKKSRSHS